MVTTFFSVQGACDGAMPFEAEGVKAALQMLGHVAPRIVLE
jgi:hypothetical protein